MNSEAQETYEFGDYRLDVVRRTLTRLNGDLVELKPKVFDVLRHLVEHAGELVEKKAVLAAVWPDADVKEGSLNKCISELRQALGDDPDTHEYIATIPGRGYQLARRVVVSSASRRNGSTSPAEPSPSAMQKADPATARSALADVVATDRPDYVRRGLLGVGLVSVGAAVGATAAVGWMRRSSVRNVDLAPTRASLDVRPAERLEGSDGSTRPSRTTVRVSPDGRTLVFAGVRNGRAELFRRRLQDSEATAIPGTQGARSPFFSPDGKWVGFWLPNRFMKAPLDGGPPLEIGPAGAGLDIAPMGVSWGPDDQVFFSMVSMPGIWSMPAAGGTPRQLSQPKADDAQWSDLLPHALPNGRAVLFTTVVVRGMERPRVIACRLDSGERREVLQDASDARYVASGHLLFMRRGTLMAAAFDAELCKVTGPAVPVVDNVMHAVRQPNDLDETWAGQYDVANGTLVYLPGGLHPLKEAELLLTNRLGIAQAVQLPTGPYFGPRLSPDGRHIAYVTGGTLPTDLWVHDFEQRNSRRLTTDGGSWPVWSPDGRMLLYRHRDGPKLIAADSSGPPTSVPNNEGWGAVTCSWKGSVAMTVVSRKWQNPEIWSLAMDATGLATSFMQADYPLRCPALSPDGRWLAYASWETGAADVYITRHPEGGKRIRVSTKGEADPTGGFSPVWTRGGRELVYVTQDAEGITHIFAVDIDTEREIRVGTARELFAGPYMQTLPANGYDVSADGEKFIMAREEPEPPLARMQIVLDWGRELARLVPV